MRGSRYISLAYNFWKLVRNAISEMEDQGNKSLILSNYDEGKTDKERWKEYEEKTNWNDNNIGVPTLFNFYHGLELYMKGLLDLVGLKSENKGHKLKALYELIKSHKEKFSPEIMELLKKHILEVNKYNPFFKENKIDINQFYSALKYPESNNGTEEYFFGDIRGKGDKSLRIYQEIKNATIDFFNAIVRWRCKEDNIEQYLMKY